MYIASPVYCISVYILELFVSLIVYSTVTVMDSVSSKGRVAIDLLRHLPPPDVNKYLVRKGLHTASEFVIKDHVQEPRLAVVFDPQPSLYRSLNVGADCVVSDSNGIIYIHASYTNLVNFVSVLQRGCGITIRPYDDMGALKAGQEFTMRLDPQTDLTQSEYKYSLFTKVKDQSCSSTTHTIKSDVRITRCNNIIKEDPDFICNRLSITIEISSDTPTDLPRSGSYAFSTASTESDIGDYDACMEDATGNTSDMDS